MKSAAGLVAAVTIALLTSCNGSGGGTSGGITTVSAATTYSNASLSGTYAFSIGDPVQSWSWIGTFTADGNGNITSGSATFASATNAISGCTLGLTGSYSVQSDGSGSASWTWAPGGSNPCTSSSIPFYWASSWPISLEVAQQGASVVLVVTPVNADRPASYSFTAIKQ